MKAKSLKTRLMWAFCLIAIVPNIIISIISLGNTVKIVNQNVTKLTQINLAQVYKNTKLTLSGYKDLLFQIYTDDNIIELMKKINNEEDISLHRNQLIRELRQIAEVKGYIASVMLIPQNGEPIFYDKLTAASTKSSWFDSLYISEGELYRKVASTNENVVLPAQKVSIAGEDSYLFHAAHRLIDYQDIEKDIGVVVFSYNIELLNSICEENTSEETREIFFLLDENNGVISFPDNYGLGKRLHKENITDVEKKEIYRKFVKESHFLPNKTLMVNYIEDAESGWTIVNVVDQESILEEIKSQRNIVIFLIIISFTVSCCLSLAFTTQLTNSVNQVKDTMKKVAYNNLSVRIKKNPKMSEEIEMIAEQFNGTLDKLEDSIKKEKHAIEKQKEAEIKFLEAQINPHFLYNILDTINWMAIDQEQYEISNVINALAYILRYGIEENNRIVPISSEIEWLKKYICLQQARIMTEIECQIKVEKDVMKCRIHKLLLQPFVENAVIHGVDKTKEKFVLKILVNRCEEKVKIVISDNGKGMEDTVVRELEKEKEDSEKDHIGIKNASERIRVYYGDAANVQIKSVLGEGTDVFITIPDIKGDEKDESDNY